MSPHSKRAKRVVNVKKTTNTLRGEIFYDDDCALCTRGATRWGELFERRGFHWLPLQTPDTTTRTGASEAELRAEMKLRFPDGRVIGGVDAWVALFRSVWWLWPMGTLIGLSGVKGLSAAAYRWFARNRHCISGACGLRHHSPAYHRHGTFFELP